MRAARAAIAVVVSIGLLVALAWLQAAREGTRAMAASDAALAEKRPELAIAEASLAASYAAPLSPWAERGRARLRSLADQAEARGDDALAEAAWRGLLAAEASGGPLTSSDARTKEAVHALARLGARRALVQAARAPGLPHPDEATLERAYARSPRPPPLTLGLLGVGAIVFAAAALELSREAASLASTRTRVAAAGLAVGAASVAAALVR